MGSVTRWVAACIVTAIASISSDEAGAGLASHRAIYTMSLDSATAKSDVSQLTGQMAFEVAEVCDGWTLEQRIALEIVDLRGNEVSSYTSFTSWESKDGKNFRFAQETKHNGRTIEKLKGQAELGNAGSGVAYLSQPEAMEIRLPAGTLFPSRHTEQLIERAQAGDSHFVGVVFDGSTTDNPNKVSAFIGKRSDVPSAADDSESQTAWSIRLAFFSLQRQAPEPDVEIGLLLQSDGIAREVWLDYGSFTIHGKLDAIELLSPMAC